MKLVAFMTLAVMSATSSATLVMHIRVRERDYVPSWIAHSSEPIDIRVVKIADNKFIDAISRASRRAQVFVLVDEVTPELRRLVPKLGKSLQIRVAWPEVAGRFYGNRLTRSYVNVGRYVSWSGPPTWRPGAFARDTHIVAESGYPSWQLSPKIQAQFHADFAESLPLRLYLPKIDYWNVLMPPHLGVEARRLPSFFDGLNGMQV